tara:strand:- start:109 stop:810 length:702 start_codon:yes stop_codon:yes gene_type:complete
MQKIFNFFPLSVFKSTISVSQVEKDKMLNEILKMENNSKNPDYKTDDSAWTGDTQGYEFLHHNKKFDKLFLAIEKSIKEYLESFSIDHTQIDLYFQRSWATISRKKENIAPHRHAQSHLSFAYYLKKGKDDSKLSFFDHNRHNEFIPGFLDSLSVQRKNIITSRNILNSPSVAFDVKEDDIVIFPSKSLHGTQKGVLNSERVSISADIMILAKNSENLEHLITPIDKWKIFSN